MSNNYYGPDREPELTKTETLANSDFVRVVNSGVSRNMRFDKFVEASAGVSGGDNVNTVVVNTNYVATLNDDVIFVDVTSGNLNITLPTIASSGKQFTVKKIDGSTNDVIVQGTGGQTIDGSVTVTLSGSGGAKPASEFTSQTGSPDQWYITNA